MKVLRKPQINIGNHKNKKKKILISFVLLVLLLVGFSYFSKISKLQIQEIQVLGAKAIDPDLIKKNVESNLDASYFKLFSKRNIFLLPRNKIKSDLFTEIPRISNLNLSIKDKNLILEIEERDVQYLICSNQENYDCYFIDKESYVFSKAPYFSPNVYFTLIIDEDPNIYLGRKFFDNDYFTNIINFIDKLNIIKIKVVSLYVKNNEEYEFWLDKRGAENYPKIFFLKEVDLDLLYNNFTTFLQDEVIKNEIIDKYESLDYIDLRFGNKIYYKFR